MRSFQKQAYDFLVPLTVKFKQSSETDHDPTPKKLFAGSLPVIYEREANCENV